MSAIVLSAAAPAFASPRRLRLVEVVTSIAIFYALGFAAAFRI